MFVSRFIAASLIVAPIILIAVQAANAFKLPLFTPPITGACAPGAEKSCSTESRCEGHGGYWYRLSDCSPLQCYREKHNDVLLMEPLLGVWKLYYKTNFHGPQKTRILNFNEISAARITAPEDCSTSDFYLIIEPEGCGSNSCTEGYVQVVTLQDSYTFLATLSDGMCCGFNLTSGATISGLCSYDDCDNPVLPMTGYRQ